MTIFFDEENFSRRKQVLRHRHSSYGRGENQRPFRRATDFAMARATPGPPRGGFWDPPLNSNRPIPHVVRGSNSHRRRSPEYFQDGEADCSNSSAPKHHNRYDQNSARYTSTSTYSHINSDNVTAPPRLPAPDENFAQLSRLFYKIIKLCHHLNNVAPADDDRIPSSIHHMMHQLCAMIRPAFPDHTICADIKYNAKQWCSSTLRALEQHYSTLLSDLLLDVALILPRTWSSPFLVATRWAKKNFFRLHQTTLDRAKQLITSHATEMRPPADPDTVPLPRPPATPDPPASPAVPVPPLSNDILHPEPTTCGPHHPSSSTSPAGKTRKHRSPPKAAAHPTQTPRLSKRLDSQSHCDLTSGDEERPCTSAPRPPERHKVNNHRLLKPSDAGRLVLTDPRGADATDDFYDDDDEPEEFHDTSDESLTLALDQPKPTLLQQVLQRSVTSTCMIKAHTKNDKKSSHTTHKKHKTIMT